MVWPTSSICFSTFYVLIFLSLYEILTSPTHYYSHALDTLLALVVGVPVVSWALKAPFADSLASSYLMLTLLGQFTGIVGAQLFAFALVLSARLRFMEFFFGGLDRLYVIHHRVGVIAFSLLAIHPIILAFRFIQDSIEDVMWYLMPYSGLY